MDYGKVTTIKDVALLAGVSIGTVSNVLNGLPGVKNRNKENVLRAIRQLNYSPNTTAQSLKTNRSKTIGLMLPAIDNPFYPELTRGVEDYAKSNEFSIILCNTNRDYQKETQYLEVLFSKRVEGVILVKTRLPAAMLKQTAGKLKYVLVDSLAGGYVNADSIGVDNYGGCTQMMEFLHENGHTKIAFIKGDVESRSAHDRFLAYTDFLSGINIAVRDEYVKSGSTEFSWKNGYRAAQELLALADRPTAVFASNDIMAIGAIKAIKESGLRVPEDISVCGFDDIEMCELVSPALTTVYHPKYEQGVTAARLLIDLLTEKEPSMVRNFTLKTELIIRGSAGPAAV